MPGFKTHSLLALNKLTNINSYVELNKEDIKTYAMGPDTLITTDYKTFNYQHAHKVKEYFTCLIDTIKKEKLYNDPEVMAFLYAQIDHYILDVTCHPLIYYLTQNEKSGHIIDSHALAELEIDNFLCKKFNEKEKYFYHKRKIDSFKLRLLIDKVYYRVFKCLNGSMKYDIGMNNLYMFEDLVRKNGIGFSPLLLKTLNTGNVCYKDNIKDALPYMNFEHNKWTNPETGDTFKHSMMDLFSKSKYFTLETINDINNYLYKDKPLVNRFIDEDISYNTDLPCEKGQSFTYVKKI